MNRQNFLTNNLILIIIGLNIAYISLEKIQSQYELSLRRIRESHSLPMIAQWKGYSEEERQSKIEEIAERHKERWDKEELKGELTKLNNAVLAGQILSDVTPETIDKFLRMVEKIEPINERIFRDSQKIRKIYLKTFRVLVMGGQFASGNMSLYINDTRGISEKKFLEGGISIFIEEDMHLRSFFQFYSGDNIEFEKFIEQLKDGKVTHSLWDLEGIKIDFTQYIQGEMGIFDTEYPFSTEYPISPIRALIKIIAEIFNDKLVISLHEDNYIQLSWYDIWEGFNRLEEYIRPRIDLNIPVNKKEGAALLHEQLLPRYIHLYLYNKKSEAQEVKDFAFKLINLLFDPTGKFTPQQVREKFTQEFEDLTKDLTTLANMLQSRPELQSRLQSPEIQTALENLWRIILGN